MRTPGEYSVVVGAARCDIVANDGTTIADCYTVRAQVVNASNARFLALAPRMETALRTIYVGLTDHTSNHETFCKCSACAGRTAARAVLTEIDKGE